MAHIDNPHRSDEHSRPWKGRYEDEALVTGHGRYSSDGAEGALHAVFVRSPHARADIRTIDISAAQEADGVVAVLLAGDIESLGYNSVSGSIPFPGRDGKMPHSPFRPALNGKNVMHVGEAVALVVAKTRAAAQDAADMVQVDYAPQPAVVDLKTAKAGKNLLWPEAAGNVTLDWTSPADPDGKNRAAVEAALKSPAHVVKAEILNQRIAAVSMEPRSATASYDKKKDSYTFHAGTQGVTGVKGQLLMTTNIAPEKLRVLSDDVGGGFGMKASIYPEYPALLAAAKITGKPVHWSATRMESFLMDNQARDSVWRVELALDEKGKFLALKVDGDQNVGAYMTGVAVLIPTIHIAGCLPSVYHIPHIVVDSKCYFTNTCPTGPYRGAGRPEANYLLERIIDAAAKQTGIDPVKLRQQNLIKPSQLPYPTPLGPAYDSGDFPTIFKQALEASDYKGFKARKKESAKRGKLRGIALCGFLEISGGHYHEPARIAFKDGKAVVSIGPTPQGQGHITVFKQMVSKRFGISDDDVIVTHGDSARDVPGFGAVASRTAMLTGSAVAEAVDQILDKAADAAATMLQTDVSQLAYENGSFSRKGTGQKVSLFDVAEHARETNKKGGGLDTTVEAETGPSFPNGCHVAEVEVDPDTGAYQVVAYTAVGDVGIVLNEKIVEGQVQGGVAQGIGQAVGEYVRYDDSGQLIAASFMDYHMPRADDVPDMKVLHHPVRCKTNYVGAKGTGEAGTTAAPPVIVNAIENAIAPDRVLNLQMPVTPEAVWRAMHG
ncbi:MAG: xanthine dehydrogenase family protein molybdopterin-binding subunit [Beijerinckiaceae bacterium]